MTRKVSNYQYDIGVIGSRSHLVKMCNMTRKLNSSFIFITDGVHIWHNDCLTSYVSITA